MKKKPSVLRDIITKGSGEKFDPRLKVMIVSACTAFDCICFYATYSEMLKQSVWLNISTVVISALCMELFPVALATIMSRSERNRMEQGLIYSIVIAFVCEAILAIVIRINTREVLFLPVPENSATWYAQLGIVILLSIMPILTSIIAFAVSYENPERRRKEWREEQLLTLKEEINKKEVEIGLVEEDIEVRDLARLDKTRFEIANLLLDLVEIGAEIKTGQVMAATLKDVDATTILTDNPEIEKQIKAVKEKLEYLIRTAEEQEEIEGA